MQSRGPPRAAAHTLLYSTQCPNCARFLDALRRTPVAKDVAVVDVATLSDAQLTRVAAVPALVLARGETLYGTKAFEWLKAFEADVDVAGFDGENGALAFSDIDTQGYATYATVYSPFEPVRD